MPSPVPLTALVAGPAGWASWDGQGLSTWPPTAVAEVAQAASTAARVVVWSAARDLDALVAQHRPPPRILDLAECHRLTHGGWPADPGRVWAAVRGLACGGLPDEEPDDLFAALTPDLDPEQLCTPEGYLRADAVAGTWQRTPQRLAHWARAAYEMGQATHLRMAAAGGSALASAISESSAALLCRELERDGLPIHRADMSALIAAAAG
ncbi:MAG TPA: DNA polymerase I, partial [Tetrasphaera sp.]|nr:DNA polymerase I [Tetrasphaera sp.]